MGKNISEWRTFQGFVNTTKLNGVITKIRPVWWPKVPYPNCTLLSSHTISNRVSCQKQPTLQYILLVWQQQRLVIIGRQTVKRSLKSWVGLLSKEGCAYHIDFLKRKKKKQKQLANTCIMARIWCFLPLYCLHHTPRLYWHEWTVRLPPHVQHSTKHASLIHWFL